MQHTLNWSYVIVAFDVMKDFLDITFLPLNKLILSTASHNTAQIDFCSWEHILEEALSAKYI